MGTTMRVRQVSRQLNQKAPERQAMMRRGSRTTLDMRVERPWESESMSFVKRAMSSAAPLSPTWPRSSAMVRLKKRFRMSKRTCWLMSATRASCENMKKPLMAMQTHDTADQEEEGLEAVVGEVLVDKGLHPAVGGDPAFGFGQVSFVVGATFGECDGVAFLGAWEGELEFVVVGFALADLSCWEARGVRRASWGRSPWASS